MSAEKSFQLEKEQKVITPALVFTDKGLTYIPGYELPVPPESDERYEVLEVVMAGICKSDELIQSGDHSHGNPPFILGHEGVYRTKSGKTVVAQTTFNSCETQHGQLIHPLCQQEEDASLCPDKIVYGIGRGADSPHGTFARHLVVPSVSVIEVPMEAYADLPEEVTLKRLAQAEPAAVAVTALMRAGLKAGDSVFVDGIGNIGAMVALAAKSMGASWVEGTCTKRAIVNHRTEPLLELGIDRISLTGSDIKPPHSINVYIDTTPAGAPHLGKLLESGCLAKGASIVLAGVPSPTATYEFPIQRLVFGAHRIIGAISSRRDAWRWVVGDFLPKVPVERLVTGVYPMSDFKKAFMATKKNGGKVLLDPQT